MDRTQFLHMCQKVSMLETGICNVKQNVSDDLKVIYNGILYYPYAYKLSFDKGQTVHTAILHDLKANAIMECNLERVEKYEQSGSDSFD